MEEDTIVSKRAEEVKPRQVAAVRGITPSQPAPINQRAEQAKVQAPTNPDQTTGFMGFIKRLFGGAPAAPVPAPVVVASSQPAHRPARKQPHRRGRPDQQRSTDAQPRNLENTLDASENTGTNGSGSAPKPKRGRNPRPEQEKATETALLNGAESPQVSAESKEGSEEKRRSRNRRNRNRNKDRADRNDKTTDASEQLVLTEQMPDQSANATPQVSSNTVVASSVAPSQTVAVHEAPTPVAVVAQPVAMKAVPKVPVALPTVAMEALNREPLEAVLSHVGLVWVDTNPERHQEVLRQIAAQPIPAHVPREPRPAAPLTEGPMILVETGGAERVVH